MRDILLLTGAVAMTAVCWICVGMERETVAVISGAVALGLAWLSDSKKKPSEGEEEKEGES